MIYVTSVSENQYGEKVDGILVKCRPSWELVENKLTNRGFLFLHCDGYQVMVRLNRKNPSDRSLSLSINGKVKTEWFTMESNVSKKFFQQKTTSSWNQAEQSNLKALIDSRNLGTDEKKRLHDGLMSKVVVYDNVWRSWGPFKTKLMHCSEIVYPCTKEAFTRLMSK